jgi:SAM-dependent methyltransferase
MGGPAAQELAPGVPPDYYRAIADAEAAHWWHRGMLDVSAALLGPRLTAGGTVLDAGCGTGGFLRFLAESGRFDALAGADIASTAVEIARPRLPRADLRVAPLHDLPFDDDAFALVATNDVLQHVPEAHVAASLRELGRVLASDGALLVRTNGARRLRREREDWRAYDRETLRDELGRAGFRVERITHANYMLSLVASARGRTPHAPSASGHGIPKSASRLSSAVGGATLRAEASWLRRGGSIPYGHTLLALATRP